MMMMMMMTTILVIGITISITLITILNINRIGLLFCVSIRIFMLSLRTAASGDTSHPIE